MRAETPVVECKAVSRSFVSEEGGKHHVLQRVNLSISEGEFVVLIGPSGCGKSTLLNIIGGFDKPSSGEVLVSGLPVTSPGPDKAMVFQDYALLPWLNTRENIEIGLKLKGYDRQRRREKAEEVLSLVGLEKAMERPVYKLSGGMQQRVSIARALALQPKVLLMDEPFGALDAFQRAIMHEELAAIWRTTRTTIIFVTHSLEEALMLGTRVVAMSPGRSGLAGELAVDLPEQRDPMTQDFIALKRRLLDMVSLHRGPEALMFLE
jgi:ABC-type nitrate/sulfonate/bicarbonate transport system ATPase subunit